MDGGYDKNDMRYDEIVIWEIIPNYDTMRPVAADTDQIGKRAERESVEITWGQKGFTTIQMEE